MTRPASPCPFYRLPCEYVPMAHRTDELEAENAKLRAALAELGDYNRFGWTMQTEIARAALGCE